jgi:hypothetical protein
MESFASQKIKYLNKKFNDEATLGKLCMNHYARNFHVSPLFVIFMLIHEKKKR